MRTTSVTSRCLAGLFGFCVLAGASAATPAARCLRIGEGAVAGRLLAVRDGALTLVQEGAEREFPLDDFREIVVEGAPPAGAPSPFALWTDAGGLLHARDIRAGETPQAVDLTGSGWQAHGLPVSSLRALATGAAHLRDADGELRQVMADPPVGVDLLMVLRDGRRFALSCAVERITEAGLTVAASGSRTTVAWNEVLWLVLGSGGALPRPAPTAHVLELADGSRIRAASFALADGVLTATNGPVRYRIDARSLRHVIIGSEAYRYLSDLQPAKVRLEPFLDVVWKPRLDSSVSGSPCVLDGRTYAKGIGMHTRTAMTFEMAGRYSRFLATVGVDDAAGDLGQVVFGVLADGREILTTRPLSGADPPQSVTLDMNGVQSLTLIADFGSPVDASGSLADWVEARVLR